MRLRAIVLALLGLTTVSFQSRAVTTYSSSFLEKTIATATIPDRNDMVLYFSVVVGTFKGAEIHGVAFGDGIYYQLTGTSTIFLSDKSKTLNSGDGIFIPFGVHFTLKTADAGQRPTYLEFLLLPAAGHQPIDDSNHTQSEVFRSPAPVLGLMPERNLLTLSEVEVPPQSPCDALHWRSGAALHYILSGVGAEFTRNRNRTGVVVALTHRFGRQRAARFPTSGRGSDLARDHVTSPGLCVARSLAISTAI
jgi:hypothetical protein